MFPTVLIALIMNMIRVVGKRIEKFKKDFRKYSRNVLNSLVVLYGAFFKLDETKDTFVEDREVLESVLGTKFVNCL